MSDADPNAHCAPGSTCVEGICEGVACAGSGEACTAKADCCGDLTCVSGVCHSSGSGDTPDNSNDGVTALPNTGIGGEQDDRSDPLLGITLAAGAAAFLLRKKARGAPDASTNTE